MFCAGRSKRIVLAGVTTIDQPRAWGDRLLIGVASILFLVALNWLVTYRPAYEGAGGLVEIGTVTTDAAIRRRHAGSLAWSEIEEEGAIYLRDLVYTPSGVSAEVRLKDGRVVTLPADSLVQFDEVAMSDLEITLRDFSRSQLMRLVPLPRAKRSATLPDPLFLEMLHADLLSRFAGVARRTASLSNTKAVPPPGDFALKSMSDYEIALQYPRDAQALPYVPDNWTAMAWTPVPVAGVTYQIEVSLKEKFEKTLPYEAKKNSLEVQFDKPGKYFWRVTASGQGKVMKSDTWTFQLYPRGRTDEAKDVTAKDFSTYIVQVSSNDDFDPILINRGSNTPKCPRLGLPPGEYFCRVRKGTGEKTILQESSFEVKAE